MKTIPKVAYAFWSSFRGLPFLRYISLVSFAVHNPDFDLVIYTHRDSLGSGRIFSSHEQSVVDYSDDFFGIISSYPNISIRVIDNEFLGLPVQASFSAVHFSDILRLYLLATQGGYWIDSDIIFTRSIATSSLSFPEYDNCDTIICVSNFGSAAAGISNRIGFLASLPGSPLFEELYRQCLGISGNDYQQYGAALYNRIIPSIESVRDSYESLNIFNLPNSALYLLYLTELLSSRISLDEYMNTAYVLGCHWYGGGDSLVDVVSCFDGHPSRTDGMKNIETKKGFIFDLIRYANALTLSA